ncbi:MAG: carboxymuconolactone decarboxylase family protein [Acidobacteria bacterium]|nr:carboxymuconolactone decarboxylase family protein [Acidobacteriota bacterium]
MSGPGARAGLAAWLAGVVAGDPAILAAAPGPDDDNIEESGLDIRTHAMVCLAALVAAGEKGTAYDEHVATALHRGVTPEEIAGVLVALLPTAGAARVTAAAPAVLAAIERAGADIPARSDTKTT